MIEGEVRCPRQFGNLTSASGHKQFPMTELRHAEDIANRTKRVGKVPPSGNEVSPTSRPLPGHTVHAAEWSCTDSPGRILDAPKSVLKAQFSQGLRAESGLRQGGQALRRSLLQPLQDRRRQGAESLLQ